MPALQQQHGRKPEPVVFTGRQATAQEQFLLEWGRETWKKSLDQLAGALQRLVTLNTALLGGSLAFPKDDVIFPFFRWAAAGFFLLSLGIALSASLPKRTDVNIDHPYEIEDYKLKLTAARTTAVQCSSGGLFVGLALALLGAIVSLAKQ